MVPNTNKPLNSKQTSGPTDTKISLKAPDMTVITDLAIPENPVKDYEYDKLDLLRRLGPAFDIIRHKNTQTPISL